MFLFPAEYDLSMHRKISDGYLSGQSDDRRSAYSLRIKMGCWKGKDAKQKTVSSSLEKEKSEMAISSPSHLLLGLI